MRENYKPLERYLSSLAGRTLSLTFAQCPGIIG